MEQQCLNIVVESKAIPFDKVMEVIQKVQYGCHESVMFKFLMLSGCRVKELDYLRISLLCGNIVYIPLGKNQKGHRKIKLPQHYLTELSYYRKTHRIYSDKVFGINNTTFRRAFNTKIRPKLSKSWVEKEMRLRKGGIPYKFYKFGLNGLRKNYQTILYKLQLIKWGSPEMAVEMTSKLMKHSSRKITCYHYIQNFDNLNIERYMYMTPDQLLKSGAEQTRLQDYI